MPQTVSMGPDPEALVGHVLEHRWDVIRALDEGGMGHVYEARHVFLGTRVALKILRSEVARSSQAIARLEREAYAASAIGDPRIVDVRDFGRLPTGEAYVVMEYVGGRRLLDAIRDDELSLERAVTVAIEVADALGAAHRHGIVHRDLKPENVMLAGTEVKLLDFGIALLEDTTERLTLAGQLLGTPEYMSPEQCIGGDIDERTDIYALGVLLYEMLTKTVPFEADDPMEICRLHRTEAPDPPNVFVAEIPDALNAIVMRCLQKDPDARFASMADVALALRHVFEEDRDDRASQCPTSPAPEQAPALTRAPAEPRWRAGAMAFGVGVVFLVGAGAAAGSWLDGREPPAAAQVTVSTRSAPVAAPAPTPAPAPVEAPAEVAQAPPAPPVPIVVQSTPAGARVLVDGEPIGRAPVEVERPEPGQTRVVAVHHDGYVSRRVPVGNVTDEALQVRLRRHPVALRRAEPAPAEPPEPTAEPAEMVPAAAPRSDRNPFLDPWGR